MEKKLKAPIQYNNCPAKIKAKLKKNYFSEAIDKSMQTGTQGGFSVS